MSEAVFSDKIALSLPVKRKDEDITEVRIRRPGASELRGLQMRPLIQGDVDQMIRLLPRITMPNLLEAELEPMNSEDFSALVNQAVYFLLPPSARSQVDA